MAHLPSHARPTTRVARHSPPPIREARPGYCRARAWFDALLVMLSLPIAIPIMMLAAIAIRCSSRGSVFYTQERLGLGGEPFTIWKLRSMVPESEVNGPKWCEPDDPRVTFVGKLIRKSHVDELPQLWNVLRGEMSLVGPRPERPEIIEVIEDKLTDYRDRLQVKPGLTGLAQIQLPPDLDLDMVKEKLELDRLYVSRIGVLLDARIIVGTVLYMLKVPPAVIRASLLLPHPTVFEAEVETVIMPRP